MSQIALERKDKIAILSLDRPKALNALNTELLQELLAELKKLASEEDLRCLIIRGAGEKAFVAGADIGEMAEMNPEEAKVFSNFGNEVFSYLSDFPCPVIAAVQGFALGGGFELALAADIRIASETARFAFPETGLGITPGFGGTQRLARLTNPALAAELIFTGRRVKAEEALGLGLVNLVCPADDLMAEAEKMANTIASNAPIGIRQAKKSIFKGLDNTLEEGLELEAENFAACFNSSDQKEAMQAFLNKENFKDFKNK